MRVGGGGTSGKSADPRSRLKRKPPVDSQTDYKAAKALRAGEWRIKVSHDSRRVLRCDRHAGSRLVAALWPDPEGTLRALGVRSGMSVVELPPYHYGAVFVRSEAQAEGQGT